MNDDQRVQPQNQQQSQVHENTEHYDIVYESSGRLKHSCICFSGQS